jgi:membrane protease YdiL (CAAX protease family)
MASIEAEQGDRQYVRPRTAGHFAVVLIGIGLVMALTQLPLGRLVASGSGVLSVLARESIWWLIAAVAVAWALLVERSPASSIGLRSLDRRSLRLAMWTAAFVSLVMVVQFFVVLPWLRMSHPAQVRQHILQLPLWLRGLIVLRAAVTEEVIYRGFLIPRIEWLFKSRGAALILSTAAFAWAHVRGWGAAQLVPVAIAGAAFGLLFLARRNLPANITAHFVTDAWGFLLG